MEPEPPNSSLPVSASEEELAPVSQDAGVNSLSTKPRRLVIPRIIFNVGVDDTSVNETIKNIDEQLAKHNVPLVVIEFDSKGGDIEEGFRLSKYLENLNVPLVCVVDGLAASEAFYLLQSCDVRLATGRSRVMAHEPAMFLQGTVRLKQLNKLQHDLKSTVDSWIGHAGRRLVGGPDRLKKEIADDTDWWLTAPEAVGVGALDGICVSVNEVLQSLSKNQKTVNGINITNSVR